MVEKELNIYPLRNRPSRFKAGKYPLCASRPCVSSEIMRSRFGVEDFPTYKREFHNDAGITIAGRIRRIYGAGSR